MTHSVNWFLIPVFLCFLTHVHCMDQLVNSLFHWIQWPLQALLPVHWFLPSSFSLPHILCLQVTETLPPSSTAHPDQVLESRLRWKICHLKPINAQRSQLCFVDPGPHERQACLDGGGLARVGHCGQSFNGGAEKKSSDNSSGLQYFPIRVSAASLLWIAWGKQRSRPQEIFPKLFPRSGCHPKSRFIFEHFLLRVTSSEYYILTPIGAPCRRSHIEWNGPDMCDSEPWLQSTR